MINIKKQLPNFTLDVAFSYGQGVTAIVGKTGAGKTTLLNMIAGIMNPDSGTIKLDSDIVYASTPPTSIPPEKRGIGYVFQETYLFPHLNVEGNIDYGRTPTSANETHKQSLIQQFDLEDLRTRMPRQLSGGEAKRVAIVRALMGKPRLILLDEPLSGIDPKSRAKFLPYLRAIGQASTAPILFVSHQRDEILSFASHIVLLEEGKIIKSGDAVNVLNSPAFNQYLGDNHDGIVFEGIVTAAHGDMVSLNCQGQIFEAYTDPPSTLGSKTRVYIDKLDVAIATEPPKNTSISNVIPATIGSIKGDKAKDIILILTGENRLKATLTNQSVERLKLSQGQNVFALIKAVKIVQG